MAIGEGREENLRHKVENMRTFQYLEVTTKEKATDEAEDNERVEKTVSFAIP